MASSAATLTESPPSFANVAPPSKGARSWGVAIGALAGAVASAAAVTGGWLYFGDKSTKTDAVDTKLAMGTPTPTVTVSPTPAATPAPSISLQDDKAWTSPSPATPLPSVSGASSGGGKAIPASGAGSLGIAPVPVYGTGNNAPGNSVPPPAGVQAPVPPLSNFESSNIPPPPPLDMAAPPEVIVAPSDNTYVYMAAGLVGLYFLAGEWYRYHEGRWYRSPAYNGRWSFIDRGRVPRSVLAVPPEYPRFVGREYQRIPYGDVNRHWRDWDRQKHWNQYNWYRRENRSDVRSDRTREIEQHRGTGLQQRIPAGNFVQGRTGSPQGTAAAQEAGILPGQTRRPDTRYQPPSSQTRTYGTPGHTGVNIQVKPQTTNSSAPPVVKQQPVQGATAAQEAGILGTTPMRPDNRSHGVPSNNKSYVPPGYSGKTSQYNTQTTVTSSPPSARQQGVQGAAAAQEAGILGTTPMRPDNRRSTQDVTKMVAPPTAKSTTSSYSGAPKSSPVTSSSQSVTKSTATQKTQQKPQNQPTTNHRPSRDGQR